jgi:hypothetical protein
LKAGSSEIVDQVVIATINDHVTACTLEKGAVALDDCPCERKALINVDLVIAIDYGTLIVVPDISL